MCRHGLDASAVVVIHQEENFPLQTPHVVQTSWGLTFDMTPMPKHLTENREDYKICLQLDLLSFFPPNSSKIFKTTEIHLGVV